MTCHENTVCETSKGSCSTSAPQNSDECTFAEDLICLAKEAKMELLKEKMKKELEAKMGKKLDAVAKLAVEAALACLQNKIEQKQACDSYKQNLFAAITSK